MPLMTNPLAHIESLFGGIQFDIENLRRERYKIDAKLAALEEVQARLDTALEEERKKLPARDGDNREG